MKLENKSLRSLKIILVIFLPLLAVIYFGKSETKNYRIFNKLKKVLLNKNIKRNYISFDNKKLFNIESLENKKVYLTYGQSNSANHGQFGYETTENVYMFYDSKLVRFEDPASGGTGSNGSVWGRLGDLLITNGIADSVVFSSSGVGDASMRDLSRGDYFKFFKSQLVGLEKNFGEIDGILFHQGETNHRDKVGSKSYKKDFEIFLKKLSSLTNAPIYFSQTSICNNKSDMQLLFIQNEIITKYKNVLRGPNSDVLKNKKYRLPDNCHFSYEGLNALSKLWLDAIKYSFEL